MTGAGYNALAGPWGPRARLAWDAIQLKAAEGIPSWMLHTMDVPFMEEMTGNPAGSFAAEPARVYLAFQELAGTCFIDQFIPENCLTMESHGFGEVTARTASTGAEEVVLDGMRIDSPDAVIEHLERFVWPARAARMATFDPDDPAAIEGLIAQEVTVQERFGVTMLKGPFMDGFQSFPTFHNYVYGYENYLMAYALYPEVMEKDFAQQADLATLENRAAAKAICEGGLPPLVRLDYDFADSRGTLVDIRTMDALWLPHFARCIEPFLEAGVRLIWHCDGNLMEMVPRLLEAGIGGFQGFQYEDGMDYARICGMTDRDGEPLFIIAGVSVTRTLPFGSREEVADELRWLVENGPARGLMLGASSSVAPGTNRDNIRVLMEGLRYYGGRGCG